MTKRFIEYPLLLVLLIINPVVYGKSFPRQANEFVSTTQESWAVTQVGDELQIAYGSGQNYSQYGVLHLNSGYLRLINSPNAGWGTSVILLPAFWTDGIYYQGSTVIATWETENADIVFTVLGTIGNLIVTTVVRLFPPSNSTISADISTVVNGSIEIDDKPGEAFKPVFLSSMNISPDIWDTESAFAGCSSFPIPSTGWIISPDEYIVTDSFGLIGGTSSWKTNAPSVWIRISQSLQSVGWVTYSADPNNDNIGLWVASDNLMSQWAYRIIVSTFSRLHCIFLPSIIND
jgi:hypothetical protein